MTRAPSQDGAADAPGASRPESEQPPSIDDRARDELQRAQAAAGVGSWALDPATRELHWSPGMYRLLGLSGTEKPSLELFFDCVHPDDRAGLQAQIRASQGSGVPLSQHLFRLLHSNGEIRVVRAEHAFDTRVPGTADADDGQGWVSGALVDLTEHFAQDRALRESEEALARAERLSQTGTWSWRPGAVGLRWSDQLYRLLGLEPETIEPSMKVFRRFVHPDDREQWEGRFEAERSSGLGLGERFSFRVVRADGETRELLAMSSALHDDDGNMISAVGVLQDVSQLVASERALSASEAHLQEAQRFARFGSYEVDIDSGERRWSPEMYRIFEFDPAAGPPSIEEVEARIDPEDRETQPEWSTSEWESAPRRYVERYRLRLPSGTPRTVRSEYVQTAKGVESRAVFGVIQDVTDEAEAQRALRGSEEKYRRIFESAHVGLSRSRLDDGLLVDANDHFAHMLGYANAADILASDWRGGERAIGDGDRERYKAALREHGHVDSWQGRIRRRDGSSMWARFSSRLDPESGVIDSVVEDVTQARSVGRRLLGAQETERRRVAAEIHDGPTQRLAAAQMLLEAHLADERGRRAPVDEKLVRVAGHLESTLSELRRVMVGLRPSILDDFGLPEAVRSVASAAGADAEPPVTTAIHVEAVELAETTEIVVFRVAQEAITNALRHSGTEKLEVRLGRTRVQVELTVRDEGRGFAVGDLGVDDGRLGLLGMQERASLVGGRLTIHSAPGQGTTVSLLVPRDEGGAE
jgi:PAS domain S-box-containing protein